MNPLDAPEPKALLSVRATPVPQSSQAPSLRPSPEPVRGSAGPTLSPADLEEPIDDDAWEHDLEDAFFSTLDPAPERDYAEDDDPIVVRRRSRIPELLVGVLGLCMLGGLVGFGGLVGLATFTEGAATPSEPPVAQEAAPPEVPALAPITPVLEVGVAEPSEALLEPERRERRPRRARRSTSKPVEAAPRTAPLDVRALLPAMSVEALPAAE